MASYECHVTVMPADEAALKAYCAAHGHKFMCALNESGSFPRQAMASIKGSGGITEEEMIKRSKELARSIEAAGIQVVRTKTEELVSRKRLNDDTPLKAPQYWEMHLKVPMLNAAHVASLEGFKPDVHLSHNVTKYPDPQQLPNEVLVTMRLRGASGHGFACAVSVLRGLMTENGLPAPVTTHQERVIYDDNVELDSGWCQ